MNKITTKKLLNKIQVLESRISCLEKENLELNQLVKKNNNTPDHIKAELSRFQTTMDALDAVVYVSDMETYELLYLSKLGASLTGGKVGEKCYLTLQQGQDKPCDFCTNHLLLNKFGKPNKPHIWEFQNTKTKRWYQLSDQAIVWPDGRTVRLEIAFDITDRKQIEAALNKSEKLANIMVNSTSNEFMLLEPKGNIAYASEGAARVFGISAQELVGKNPFDFMNAEDQEKRWAYINKAIITKQIVSIQDEHNGVFYESNIQPIFDENEKLEYLAVFTLDITERIVAKRKIQISQKRYQDLYDQALDMYFSVNIHGVVLSVNQFGADSLGYQKDELIGQDVWKVVYEKDLAFVKEHIGKLINNEEESSELEFRKIRKDGTVIFVQEKLQFLHAKNGNEAEVRIICRDITKSKSTAIALNESEKRYHEIFQNSFSVMMQIDPDSGEIIDVNQAASDYYGYSLKQFAQMNINQLNALPDEDTQVELIKAKEGKRNHFLFKHKLSNGTIRDVEVFSSEIMIDKKVTLFSIVHDINDRKIAEQDLLESEEKLRSIFNSIDDIIFVLDKENRFVSVNAEKNGLLLGPQNFIGKKLDDVMPKYVVEFFNKAMIGVKEGETQEFEYQLEIPDGTHWYSVKISPILSRKKFSGSVAVVRDVSEAKKAEIEHRNYSLQLKERNEELDAFSHTVAHDLKNPIGVIIGFANVISENFSELTKIDILKYVSVISKAGFKTQQIIETLLLFANVRKAEVDTEILDMELLVEESLKRLSFMITDSKAVIIKPTSWSTAIGYSHWVEEVWTNYISNALKYGGEKPYIELGVDEKNSDGMHRFWVKDNGPGISAKNQRLLFKKFERLEKEVSEGHGLGLSIVRRIIEKLGGQVGLESQIGKGSIFSFTLPIK